jgi:hypothetical protein
VDVLLVGLKSPLTPGSNKILGGLFIMCEELSAEALRQIDEAIDSNFAKTPVPADHLYAAQWTLCTVGEEIMRLAIHKAALKETDEEWQEELRSVNTRADRYKYQLRHAFDQCRRRLPKLEIDGVHKLNHDEFACAVDLLARKAAEFTDATRIMSQARSGNSKVNHESETSIYKVILPARRGAYGALDRLLVSEREEANSFTLVTTMFRSGVGDFRRLAMVGDLGTTATEIVELVKKKRGRISYQVITRLAKQLGAAIDHGPTTIIPNDWKFPWGSLGEIDQFFKGLFARCLYHVISTHFGEGRFKTSTSEQRCLVLPRATLVDDLARITDLPDRLIGGMVTALTLGEGMKNPDPGLQPLIPVGAGRLAAPPIFILSCNHRRNLLSLQNRVARKEFHSMSKAFEKVTTENIEKSIDGLVSYKSNVQVPSSPKSEQVDLLLGDARHGFILVCELRSMITPGDSRQVYERIEDYEEKVDQAERKLGAAQHALAQVCRDLGLSASEEWKLGGIVILDGAAGIPSPKPNTIPIVEKRVFIEILRLTKDLKLTHAILCSPVWLPRDGTNYRVARTELEVCGFKFRLGTFELTDRLYLRDSLPTYIAEAGQRVEQLRTAEW